MASSTDETRCPRLLAANLIAIPLLFFGLLAVAGPMGHFALYLFVAWTIAAATSATSYVVDREYVEKFSDSERLAMLAASGMVALLVATTSFMAFGRF